MNFGFTEEQELLRSEARKLLDESCPIAEVRRIMETPDGFSRELWKQIAELGWVGLTIPEDFGGAGLDWVDLVVLLEETGRSLFPSPLVSTTSPARRKSPMSAALCCSPTTISSRPPTSARPGWQNRFSRNTVRSAQPPMAASRAARSRRSAVSSGPRCSSTRRAK